MGGGGLRLFIPVGRGGDFFIRCAGTFTFIFFWLWLLSITRGAPPFPPRVSTLPGVLFELPPPVTAFILAMSGCFAD